MTTRPAEFVDFRFGFPVTVQNAPMRRVRGEWVLDVNAHQFESLVLAALTKKRAPLTGHEVCFLRRWLGLNPTDFARECGVSRPAVHKWESRGEYATRMGKGTEFLIRFLVAERLPEELVDQLLRAPQGEWRVVLHKIREVLTASEDAGGAVVVLGTELRA